MAKNVVSKEFIDGVEKLNKEVAQLTTELTSLDKVLADIRSNTKKTSTDVIALQKAEVASATATDKLASAELKLAKAKTEAARKTDIEAKAQERAAKEKAKAVKASKDADSAYKKESRTLTELRNKAKDLAITLGEDSKEFRTAAKEVNKLDTRLKNIDKSLGQSQREVGRYEKAWSGVKSAFIGGIAAIGITGALSKIKDGVISSLKVFSDFGQGVSRLGAISGASASDLNALENDAKRLGATTQKTASQVSELQTEFAKLGFNPKEILKATEATLKLSIATGENLADSAAVAGSTLRGFGLNAEETQRVTDVMAASFSSSALDLEKFRESMKLVAPISKAANIDLETTTALLGNLADSGLAGSIAGTGLKNVISKLSNENSALSKELGFTVKNSDDLINAFKILKERNIDLTAATELTDERSKAAFLTMVNGIDSIEGLQKSLRKSEGAAKRMADVMADNLAGDTDKAKSAVEGLQISLGERLNSAARAVTQTFTDFVGTVDDFIKLEASEELRREQIELNALVGAATNANNTQESRNRLISDLQKEYPDFLGNLDAETVTNEQLRDRLSEVNEEYKTKINLLAQQELIKEFQEELVDLQLKEKDLIIELSGAEEALAKIRKERGEVSASALGAVAKAQGDLSIAVSETSNRLENNRAKQKSLTDELQKQLNVLSSLSGVNEEADEVLDTNTEIVDENTSAINTNTEAKEKNFKTTSEIYAEIEKEQQAQLERELAEIDVLNQAEFKALEDEEARQARLVEIKAQSAEEQKKIAEALANAENELLQAKINASIQGLEILAQIAGEGSAIAKAAFIFQQGLAIASIVKDTEVANAAATAAYAPLGLAGVPLITATKATNRLNAAAAIGSILAQTIGDFAFAEGVIDFQGKGTGTSDSNLAMISHGESVIKAKSTAKAPKLLTGINNGVITDDVIPSITGMRAIESQQQQIIFDTRKMEDEMRDVKNLLANQMYILPKEGYNLMDRKMNRINYH